MTWQLFPISLREREKAFERAWVVSTIKELVASLHLLRQNENDPERYALLELAIRQIEEGKATYHQAVAENYCLRGRPGPRAK